MHGWSCKFSAPTCTFRGGRHRSWGCAACRGNGVGRGTGDGGVKRPVGLRGAIPRAAAVFRHGTARGTSNTTPMAGRQRNGLRKRRVTKRLLPNRRLRLAPAVGTQEGSERALPGGGTVKPGRGDTGKPSHAQLRPPGSPHRQGLLCKGPALAHRCAGSLQGGGSSTTGSGTTGSSTTGSGITGSSTTGSSTTGSGTRARLGSVAGALQHSITSAGCSSWGGITPRVLQRKGGECQGQAILGRFPPHHGRSDLKTERDGTGCSTDAVLLPV